MVDYFGVQYNQQHGDDGDKLYHKLMSSSAQSVIKSLFSYMGNARHTLLRLTFGGSSLLLLLFVIVFYVQSCSVTVNSICVTINSIYNILIQDASQSHTATHNYAYTHNKTSSCVLFSYNIFLQQHTTPDPTLFFSANCIAGPGFKTRRGFDLIQQNIHPSSWTRHSYPEITACTGIQIVSAGVASSYSSFSTCKMYRSFFCASCAPRLTT